MTTLSTSAGTVAYDSHGSGDPIVLLPSAGHDHHDYDEVRQLIPGSRLMVIDSGHLPHTTSPAAVAHELAALANAAFDGGRTNRPQNGTPATKEQQQ